MLLVVWLRALRGVAIKPSMEFRTCCDCVCGVYLVLCTAFFISLLLMHILFRSHKMCGCIEGRRNLCSFIYVLIEDNISRMQDVECRCVCVMCIQVHVQNPWFNGLHKNHKLLLFNIRKSRGEKFILGRVPSILSLRRRLVPLTICNNKCTVTQWISHRHKIFR